MIRKPWTEEQVKMLNERQQDGKYHPYTCPGEWTKCNNQRELVATKDGWVCQCGYYKQDWYHA